MPIWDNEKYGLIQHQIVSKIDSEQARQILQENRDNKIWFYFQILMGIFGQICSAGHVTRTQSKRGKKRI